MPAEATCLMQSSAANPGTNWAGNYRYRAERVLYPATVDEIRSLVRGASRVKALGTRHSFHGIADSDGDLISLENLPPIAKIDRERSTVTFSAGMRYGELSAFLDSHGYALKNLASLPDISIAGAVSTGTHGSGDRNQCLSASVAALKLVNGRGEVVEFDRSSAAFPGMVVGLGALGIVFELTLKIVPSYRIRQTVYRNLPFEEAERSFDAITAGGYAVSLFTDWQNHEFSQVWVKRRDEENSAESTFFGALPALRPMHPLEGLPAENCTEQMGAEGSWHERIPHFRSGCLPSSGDELQSEYFVPREKAVEAILAVERLRDRLAPLLQISEVRTIAADDLWLSPCFARDSAAIHFTWRSDFDGVRSLLPELESALEPFDARPHWGKLCTLSAERIRSLYSRFRDFQGLAELHDPDGRFRNEFITSLLP